MQTASAALRATLASKNPTYRKVVELYRRYWTGSAYAYAAAQDITDQVVNCGRIMWKLDKEDYGVFNLDNTTVTLRNDRQQWKQDNLKGYFPSTHILAKSKIKIKIGAQLADGTFETLYVFTGYINSDPTFNIEEKTVTTTLYGAMTIFDDFNAEEISTLVTDELMGSDSGTVFATAQDGAGIIEYVKKGNTAGGAAGASELQASVDYSVSGLNTKGAPVTITLGTALISGESLWIKYRYWYTDKTLEWIVEQIMTLCGISTYTVSRAVFSASVENTWTQTTKADWDAGTGTDTRTDITEGNLDLAKLKVFDDFSDGDYTADPVWTVLSGAFSIWGGGMICSSPGSTSAASATAYGTWQFYHYQTQYNSIPAQTDIHFIASAANPGAASGYMVRIYSISALGYFTYYLYRMDGGTPTQLATWNAGGPQLGRYFRITRSAAGVFNVYQGNSAEGPWTLYATAIDNTHATSANFIFQGVAVYGGQSQNPKIDDIRMTTSLFASGDYPTTGNWISPSNDCGADIVSWGQIRSSQTVPDGTTIKFETAVSDDDSAWDDWVEVDNGGQILSAVKRYIKVRWTATADTTQMFAPTLASMILYYYTSTTTISLVNLTGMTCKAALEQIAQMCNYEIGFNASDYFIFRPRNTTLPSVLTISDETNLISLSNTTSGIDRVYNRVKATFGIYTKVSDSSADASPNSIEKYGTREYSISNSQLLPAENANMAYSVAPTILSYTHVPRRRTQALIMLRPDLELGDKANLSHREDSALKIWYLGDSRVRFGQADLEFWNDTTAKPRLSFWKTDMRTEGLEIDPETYQCTLDLTEALE